MKKLSVKIIPILICFVLTASGCESNGKEQVNVSDLIIPLNITEVIKHPEADVLKYFQKRRENIEEMGNYILENESVFQSRPVILHQDYNIIKIKDPAIQSFAQQLFQEDVIKEISSLNDDPTKTIDILIEEEPGLFRQGIIYINLPELLKDDPSKFSYVKNYTDLGGSWYYYVYHYDKVKEEKQYRELAWNRLSDKEKKTLTTPMEKAIVVLEAGENVEQPLDRNKKLELVVSVQFSTELDGLLGNIKMYFNPITMEYAGSDLRY
ncbi:hypothetical protein [Cohnella sp. GbtcB17]|uniref:hypothetical protein n=1 Tax=Cohnella sp. GbtcB17 TaxID=2824762 RepID=UPI001C300203|nr:hypothetical protein [Cohnella sp. GbtcB17]